MQPKTYIEVAKTVEAMQFTMNGELGREVMDGIVFWLNSGSSNMVAWHNGVHVYVGSIKMTCGDYVVKQNGGHKVYSEKDFGQKFRLKEDPIVAPDAALHKNWYTDSTKKLIAHLADHPDMRLRGVKQYGHQERSYKVMYRHDDDWYDDTSFKTMWTEQGLVKLLSINILASDGHDIYKLSAHGEDAAHYIKLTERNK